ncbi:helix-turn-helix domain-containing protein [Clavibacter sp. VKM Ac-2873]|uniref:helix-turn-helix domain-containing protein n=1 Tax=Clavibacter sp. VKM Ac-2873 TaxID=2783813 RepID=UPI00188A2232|nr:helix-turn-helix domain-containing protein [Clavibacter sp. VKM Ac-2873]MBF4618404.1 helix-turn-helix domain-containing protein [Clavibacter sp. VKM Ac-2873]
MLARWPEDLGNVARQQRQDLGLSQEELARRAGVTRQWLTRFETAKGDAALSKVMRVLRELDLRLEITAKVSRGASPEANPAARAPTVNDDFMSALMARVGQKPASDIATSGSRVAEEVLRRNRDVRVMVEKIGQKGAAVARDPMGPPTPSTRQQRP